MKRRSARKRRQDQTDFNSASAILLATAIMLAAYSLAIGGCIAIAGP